MQEPWRGPLLRLGGGRVLLAGSGLADVVRALETARSVSSRDGIAPHARWVWLLEQLRAELDQATWAARRGSAAVPRLEESAWSSRDLIDTLEVARMLGCKSRNVRDLRARGVLEGRLVGGRLAFERAEVAAEVLRRREASGAGDMTGSPQ